MSLKKIALGIAFLAGCATGGAGGKVADGSKAAGKAAPDFELPGRAGGTVRLSQHKGKVVVVDFWAEWCAPCKKELPALDVLAKKYKDQGLEIVAVNIDKDKANAERFLQQNGITSVTIAFDPEGAVVGKWEPATMPTSYVLDKGQNIAFVHSGFNAGDEKAIEQEIQGLLK